MPRITNEEIAELKSDLTESDVMLPGRFWQRIYPALDRLAKLEAAVAFKGFDEVPEDDSYIQLLDVNGRITNLYWHQDHGNGAPWGILGWRYPVGDLS